MQYRARGPVRKDLISKDSLKMGRIDIVRSQEEQKRNLICPYRLIYNKRSVEFGSVRI